MTDFKNVPNIGKVLQQQLTQIGIDTLEQLKATGSRQAWLSIKSIDSSACYNRLCALEGAIEGVRWHYLGDDVKQELKAFYQSFKGV